MTAIIAVPDVPFHDQHQRAVEPLGPPFGSHDPGPARLTILPSTGVDGGGWLSRAELDEYRDLKAKETRRSARRVKRQADNRDKGQRVVSLMSAMLPRLATHVIDGSIDGFQVGQLAQQMSTISDDAVRHLRCEGYSWAEVGECFGMTKQGAQQRWGRNRGIK